jgi:endonuclease/exonuclease/phosphatase family metal-dependent hydrolase
MYIASGSKRRGSSPGVNSMKRTSIHLLFFVLLAFIILPIYSEAVKIVSWNLLNFPGTTGAAREAYFRMVIDKLDPDVLVVQEMISKTGVNQFLNNVMNYTYPGEYAAAGFTDGKDTDNAMFYKRAMIFCLTRKQIKTDLRDISVYGVKIISGPSLNSEFKICSVHLKSGPSSSDKVQREYEAEILRSYLNGLSSKNIFLVCGDFNFYSSTDPAFVELTESQTDNDGRCKDPINKLGSWHDNSTYAKYHTQSPRGTAFGGGASGGLDDRFDIIFIPYVDRNLVYKTGSYKAYGNDGLHFNKSVNSGTNSAVGTDIANALYQAADHLPVTIELVPPAQFISAPSNLVAAEASSTRVNLSWRDNSTNETGFEIERKTTSTWTQVATVGANITTYQNKNLVTNTTYYYRVRAYKTRAYSAYSNTVSIKLGGSTTVYITETGTKYHLAGCQYLSKSKIPITLREACAKGYSPCSVCDPPPCPAADEAVPLDLEDIAQGQLEMKEPE